MQTLTTQKTKTGPCPRLRRQTHMSCVICHDIAEHYDQKSCYKCGSCYKWSVPWKNDQEEIMTFSSYPKLVS